MRALTGREVLAAEQLERQGFRAFLPKQLKTVRHARKVRVALGAYFPGYLFVELDLAADAVVDTVDPVERQEIA